MTRIILALATAGLVSVAAFTPGVTPSRPALRSSLMAQAAAPASLVALPGPGYEGAVAAGAKKAQTPADKIFALGVLSGVHIGFGAFLMVRPLSRRPSAACACRRPLAGQAAGPPARPISAYHLLPHRRPPVPARPRSSPSAAPARASPRPTRACRR